MDRISEKFNNGEKGVNNGEKMWLRFSSFDQLPGMGKGNLRGNSPA